MSNILKFPSVKARAPAKFGLKRVKRRKRENPDQLDLFPASDKILRLPSSLSLFEEALSQDEAGDEQAAREMYERAIDEGDSVADAYCNLGVIESQGGHTTEAYDCFRVALKHDQQHWETHYNLGNLYFDDEQYRPARVHFELAAEIEPGFRNIHFNLGLALAIEEELQAAIEALTTYRELAPGDEGSLADDLLITLQQSLSGKTT